MSGQRRLVLAAATSPDFVLAALPVEVRAGIPQMACGMRVLQAGRLGHEFKCRGATRQVISGGIHQERLVTCAQYPTNRPPLGARQHPAERCRRHHLRVGIAGVGKSPSGPATRTAPELGRLREYAGRLQDDHLRIEGSTCCAMRARNSRKKSLGVAAGLAGMSKSRLSEIARGESALDRWSEIVALSTSDSVGTPRSVRHCPR